MVGREEVWQNKGSYAAGGQFLVVELSAAEEW